MSSEYLPPDVLTKAQLEKHREKERLAAEASERKAASALDAAENLRNKAKRLELVQSIEIHRISQESIQKTLGHKKVDSRGRLILDQDAKYHVAASFATGKTKDVGTDWPDDQPVYAWGQEDINRAELLEIISMNELGPEVFEEVSKRLDESD